MRVKAPPAARFAVVTQPGTLFERVDSYHQTMLTATAAAQELREDGEAADAMRITPSGELSTEF